MHIDYPKLIFAIAASAYFLSIAYDPMQGSFLDMVDLPIHETGHLIFHPFGEFIGIAGGSLFQVILPAAFVGYFVWRSQYYSAAIVMLWVGQSILNVWVYAADAVVMRLILTSGLSGSEGGFHDWNYLLTRTGLLGSAYTIAGAIRAFGTIAIVSGSVLSIYYSLYSRPAVEEL